MNIAETIRNGIPKIGTSFISKTYYDYFHSTPNKLYQVIGYRDYYDELMVDFVTDDYKTLRLEHYTVNDLLSMNLEQGVHVLNKDSIKKINIKDKETNKFYLDMYGIYYKTQFGYSLIFNGRDCDIFKQMKNMHSYQEYEITDIREIKKILERQKEYYDEMSFYSLNQVDEFALFKNKSFNELLNSFYYEMKHSFLMNKVITYKLLEIVEKNEQQGLI